MSDDPFDFGDDQPDETPAPTKKEQDRAAYLERQLNKLQKEAEELRTFKAERMQADKTANLNQIFTELGVDPKRLKYFQVDHPDAEPDKATVASWAQSEGFLAAEVEIPEPQPTGFTPTTAPQAVAPGAKRYSAAEWTALAREDPTAAQAAFQSGRVDFSDVRQGLGPDR